MNLGTTATTVGRWNTEEGWTSFTREDQWQNDHSAGSEDEGAVGMNEQAENSQLDALNTSARGEQRENTDERINGATIGPNPGEDELMPAQTLSQGE